MGKRIYAVIGAGNGGQAMAAHLAMLGHEVRLYDIDRDKIKKLSEKEVILLRGQLEGEAKISLITEQIEEAVYGSDAVFVVTTTTGHDNVAESLGRYLKPGQAVILCPGQTGGAIIVRNILRRYGKDNPIAEMQDLIYACRTNGEGVVNVSAVKRKMEMAAFGREEYIYVYQLIKEMYPQISRAPSVLHTGFNNTGVILHPVPMLLNAGRIECGEDFLYYHQGITPSVAAVMEQIDQERIAAGRAYGIDVLPIGQWLRKTYDVGGESLYDLLQNNMAYASVKAPTSLSHRFVTEDIPNGMIPMLELGDKAGVGMPVMHSVVRLANVLLKQDFYKSGRNLKALGLEDKSVSEIKEMFKE